jgi:hypothetical protein
MTAAELLDRRDGQLSALVLLGKDVRPVLPLIDKLRREERRRPGGWPTEAQLRGSRRSAHVRSHVARNVYVAGCEWCVVTRP